VASPIGASFSLDLEDLVYLKDGKRGEAESAENGHPRGSAQVPDSIG
jgi:hypothetical protein